MKKTLFILLFLIYSSTFYSQTHNCNFEQNQLKIYEFVKTNFDSITAHTDAKIIDISIDFDAKPLIQKINYYPREIINGIVSEDEYEYEDEYEDERGIKVWGKLDTYVRSLFFFCPSLNFDSEDNLLINTTLRIPLMYNELQKNIDSFPDYSYTLHSIRQNKIIIPNNKFSVDVKKFNLGREERGNLILSELNYYDSDIINIAPLHYLYFKVNISSQDGIPKNTIEYKLYKATNSSSKLILKEKGIPIQNNGVAELFFKQINRQNDNITSSYEMFIELKFD